MTAIERRESYAPERRVRPWLLGILRMRAKRLPRDARTPDAARLHPRTAPEPVGHSEALELDEALDAAIETLAPAYRPVLRLHLRHGMPAVEIAHALSRPAGTVRTQIVRGLEALRRRLPASLAAALATSTLAHAAPRGLASLRCLILEEARQRAPGGAKLVAGKICGAWIVKKASIISAAVLGLVLLGTSFFVAQRDPSTTHTTTEDGETSSAGVRASQTRAQAPRGSRRAVEAPGAASGPREAAGLLVRLTWAASDEAAAEIGVSLDAVGACELARRTAVSDADGIVRFDALDPGQYHVSTNRGAARKLHVAPHRTTHTTLRIARGQTLRGTVVDVDGNALEGADVAVSVAPNSRSEELFVTRSAALGRFEIRGLSGRRYVSARAAGYAVSRRCCVDPEEDTGRYPEARVVLDRPGVTWTLRVVDPHGNGVARARVTLGWPSGFDGRGMLKRPPLRTVSDADGRARIDAAPIGRACVHVRAAGCAPLFQHVEIDAIEGHESTLHLEAGSSLRGRVVDGRGEAIAGARVTAYGFANLSHSAISSSDGSFRVDGLPTGPLPLSASAEGYDETTVILQARAGQPLT